MQKALALWQHVPVKLEAVVEESAIANACQRLAVWMSASRQVHAGLGLVWGRISCSTCLFDGELHVEEGMGRGVLMTELPIADMVSTAAGLRPQSTLFSSQCDLSKM